MLNVSKHLLLLLSLLIGGSVAFLPSSNHRFGRTTRPVFAFGGEDRFDMDELKQRIAQESNPYSHLFANTNSNMVKRPKPTHVHIILFNPDTVEEGVHSIEYPSGSGNNVILAFESKQECDSFAALLKAQQFFDPSPREMKLDELEQNSSRLGVFVQVVPEGMHIVPPSARVDTLGHNPNLRDQQYMLDYVFEMSDTEPEEEGVLEFGWE